MTGYTIFIKKDGIIMTLLQLQYFETLARVLHYTHAAEELHIAQPSLSYSINELEKELGVKLFEKQNRKICLTDYGDRFLPYVQKSLMLMDEGTNMLKQMAGTAPQLIRLGYFHSISSSLVPSVVQEVYKIPENKEVRFQFTEDTSFDIFNSLKNGKLDLAFCTHRDDWADSISIMKQPLYLVVPLGHALAERSYVSFEDFAREPQVMLDKASSLRKQIDHAFTQRGVIPGVVFEVRECNAALQYVALKFGVSILPEVPAMKTERVCAIPIADKGKEFVRTVYLSWDRSRPPSPVVQRIRNFIVQRYACASPD